MTLKRIILTIVIAVITCSAIGYCGGYLLGKSKPDYITYHFVPAHYLNEDGSVKESSYWGVPGTYRPEKLGADIGTFQGAIVGFWLAVILVAFDLWKQQQQLVTSLRARIAELETDSQTTG